MITLYCGRGAAQARLRLNEAPGDTLIVVPGKLSVASLCKELKCNETASESHIIDFDAFVTAIARGDEEWSQTVAPDHICRAVMRNIIESTPGDFDHLVGRYSTPRMSQGVLTRIVSAAEALSNVIETEDATATESPRRRQLRLLLKRFEERLSSAGIQPEKLALWQGIIDLTKQQWNVQFPSVQRIVFTDFDAYADEVYLAIAASSKQVSDCEVLLEYDPDDDRHAGSRLELAYQRLYDMADRVVDGSDQQGPDKANQTRNGSELPLVIATDSVADEVRGIAASINAVMAEAEDAKPSVVIAIPNLDAYGAPLERALQDYGVPWEWLESGPLERGAEFLLLDRLRQCAGRFVTGSAVADLFRAPGFRALIPDLEIASVEAWDLASRLDYVLTLTGQVSGWKSIAKQVESTLDHLRSQRERSGQLNDEETAQDARLSELLEKTRAAVEPFLGQETVADWSRQVIDLLHKFHKTQDSTVPGQEQNLHQSQFVQVLLDMQQTSDAVTVEPIPFAYFVTLFRTAMHNVRVEISRLPAQGEVLLCSPEIAAKMNADVCILPGFNDGSFPKFARPDASFSGYDNQPDQRPTRARQWLQLERLIARYTHLRLWMPERQGTEELLPSQFAETLLHEGRAERISSADHLHELRASARGPIEEAESQFALYLKNVRLSPGELAKFRKYGLPVYNAARATSVMAERRNPLLGGYDGILQDPRLKAWLAGWMDRHKFSVSQLDGVVGCSFRFFADRMLHLDEPEAADDLLPATVFGSFAHDVLARFYRTWVSAGRGVLRSTDEALAREELLRAYYAEYNPSDDLSEFACDLMNLKLFGELGPKAFGENDTPLDEVFDAGVFGKFLLMEMQRGDDPAMDFLHPSNFEVGFGVAPAEEEDPLSTTECVVMDIGGGEKVRLWGRIDRIDVSDNGVFAVTDYKTGHLPTATEIAGGFRTQLPVYMLVAQDLLKKRYDSPDPAGGLYYSLKRGKAARVSGAFVRAAYQAQVGVSGRGMKDEQFLDTLTMVKGRIRDSMTALRRGYLTTTRHDPDTVCRYCEFQRLCYRDVERTAAFWEQVEAEEGLNVDTDPEP